MKRTSHITLILSERNKKTEKKTTKTAVVKTEEKSIDLPAQAGKKEKPKAKTNKKTKKA